MFRCTIPTVAVAALLVTASSLIARPTPIWNRKAEGVSVLPAPVAGPFFDITFSASIEAADLDGPSNLPTELEIRVNGLPVHMVGIGGEFSPPGHANCAGLNCGSEPCFCAPPPVVCERGAAIISAVATTSLQPGDEIIVLLRPARGALPELPGFPDDEETRPVCPWDCGDGDFMVGITDFLKLLGQWGPCFPV
jgi:hypothetical protein